jgi:hypothetical protein
MLTDPKYRSEKKNQYRVRVRFIDDDGTAWTVWDTTFSEFDHHIRPHTDSSATARVFVNAAGVKRSYTLHQGESRVLEPQALEQQLRKASFFGETPDLSKRTPR